MSSGDHPTGVCYGAERTTAQSAGDAGFEVDLGHAELDFQAGDFDGVAGFVGDDVPADVAAAAVELELAFVLADQSKFNKISPITFANISGATIITGHLEDKKYRDYTTIIEGE